MPVAADEKRLNRTPAEIERFIGACYCHVSAS